MPVTFKRESAFYKVPPLSAKIPQAPAEILMADVFGTDPETKAANPLSAMMFVMEATKELVPSPPYEYDETGIVLKGSRRERDGDDHTQAKLSSEVIADLWLMWNIL
ncbi:hypothetical protein ACJ41O_006107 [Fusarium nematophilum]